MRATTRDYVPAAGHDWALPLYDPLVRLSGMGKLRDKLVERAELRAGQRLLDIGCGTGSLLLALKRRMPETHVTGLDPDPKALGIAHAKAQRAGLAVQLDRGFSDRMPYSDGSFQHVFSSFMFHHLEPQQKRATLREVRRVLAAGGVLHLLDFRDDPHAKSPIMRVLHAASLHEKLAGQLQSGVEAMIEEAGFEPAQVEVRPIFFFGAVGTYRAARGADRADGERGVPEREAGADR
jgi:ubiquinone/menaquinone biosynthesis C-methylase UbiE